MTIDVRVNNVLGRCGEVLERRVEFLPVICAIQFEREVGVVFIWIESGPAQSVALAVILKNDWSMTRDSHVMSNDVTVQVGEPFAHLDLFLANRCVLPTRR